jgi:hypothetical protein
MTFVRSLFWALVAVILGISYRACAQTTVVLAPIPQFFSILSNGSPNAFGCLFTYYSNTTTPLSTYTDFTGNTLNANPVILSAAGTANAWLLSGQTYSFVVKTAGGVNCAFGSTIGTWNGIGGGASTQTTPVAYAATPTFTDTSQNQLFTFTLNGAAAALPLSVVGVTPPGLITFQITENSTGGYTFGWPPNVIGGAPINTAANAVTTQEFVWNGTTATALGPGMIGTGLSTVNANITGALTQKGFSVPITITLENNPITQTGDTALHTIYTIPIPGGLQGIYSLVRITLYMAINSSTGSPSVLINYGGTSISPGAGISTSLGHSNGVFLKIVGGNIGVTNSQTWETESVSAFATSSPGNIFHATSAIDSTSTQNLTVTFQGGSSSDSITFYRCIVEQL